MVWIGFCVNMQVGKLEEWSQGENRGEKPRHREFCTTQFSGAKFAPPYPLVRVLVGPADSHSLWDSAAPRSFATSSTCFFCALRAFCSNWWYYTCSGTFHSCSWGPLLSTRGAYHLIIRSLLIYIICFWMLYIFWTTFILGLDVFHVYLVYCTLSVYIFHFKLFTHCAQ